MTPAELMACTNAVSRFAAIRNINKHSFRTVCSSFQSRLSSLSSAGDGGPTTAQAAVGGQLQTSLRAVPAVPRKLVLALLDAALSSSGHAAGVDQVGLWQQQAEGVLE